MSVQGIRGIVEAAIDRAAKATGVDFGFLMKTAHRESSFNPKAQASTSSAAGLFQFVEQTWLSTLKQHGARHGYGQYADLISRGSDGRYRVSGEARKAVMDLRLDPHAASLMAGELTSDHASYLKGRVGRAPTGGELYAAHFLGPQGSARLIEAVQSQPGASAASLFPDAARANRSIFYREGRSATVGEVYANLTRGGGSGEISPAVRDPEPDGGFIRVASSGLSTRQQEQQALISLILNGTDGQPGADRGGRLTGSIFTSEMLKLLSDSRES
jgi:hypothetical protein